MISEEKFDLGSRDIIGHSYCHLQTGYVKKFVKTTIRWTSWSTPERLIVR